MDKKEIEKLKKEYEEISEKLTSQDVVSDPEKLQELSKRHSDLQKILNIAREIEELEKEIKEHREIIKTSEDEELTDMAENELEEKQKKLSELERKLDSILNPKPGSQINEAIVEVRAGAGGSEAALFAQDLFRMYTKYAENKGWEIKKIDENKDTLGGVKEVVFEVKGDGVYNLLKSESGVHRVQRVPETEKGGRLHTSTASVAVLPKAKKVDIEIKPEDVKIETFRSSGPGGQNVNKVETAVRVTHLPTGIAVASQVHKSQAQNRESAMTLLRSKLLKIQQEKEERERKKQRSQQIGGAERSEKIRTYNFPQDRITDHRINKSWHKIEDIMNGNLDDIISELEKNIE